MNKRIVSFLIAFVMVALILPLTSFKAEAATLTLAQLQQKYPSGSYWNHYVSNASLCGDSLKANGNESYAGSVSNTPCKTHAEAYIGACVGGYDCNYFDGGIQCVGFARRLGYEAFGSYVRSWAQHDSIASIKPGDVVHMEWSGNLHAVFVTSISGSVITVGEANFIGDPCRISWGGTYNLNNYKIWVYSAPRALSNTPVATEPIRSWDHYADKHWVGSTNAVLAGWCNLNVDNSAVSKVGIYLYDYSGKELKTTSENTSFGGYYHMYMWYDVNNELGYTLLPGTPYKYKFMIVINGKTYYSPVYDFTTGGTHAHKYNSGTVTKNPSCTGTGTKTFTCTTCGGTKTESISAKGHSYANATCTTPKKCTVCGATSGSALGHKYNSGVVTKAATCKEAGIKTFTCSVCKGTRTETIAKLTTHTYGSGVVTKPATCKETGIKTYTCTVCKGTKTETVAKLTTHTYDNSCDTACNICGATRTVTHQYGNWSKDQSKHWHACTLCGHKANQTSHTPGAAATETKAQTCTVCGYVIQAALGHTHSYDAKWDADASGHWHTCACGGQADYATHKFDNSCDTDCSTCGYTRTITHTPGTPATATTDQICTVCNQVLVPATGEITPSAPQEDSPSNPTEETKNEPTTEDITEPADKAEIEQADEDKTEPPKNSKQENSGSNDSNNIILWICIPVIVIAAIAGGFFLGRSKKKS